MAFCSQCGAQVEDSAKFCTSCGAKIDTGVPPVTSIQMKSEQTGNANSSGGQKASGSFDKFFAFTDTTASFADNDREQNRLVSVLAYLHILVLVPLIGMKESPFAQYHAKVGLNLFLWHLCAEIGGKIIIGIIGWIPVIGWIVSLLFTLLNLALWCINVFGIVSAAQGKARELEIVAPLKFIK